MGAENGRAGGRRGAGGGRKEAPPFISQLCAGGLLDCDCYGFGHHYFLGAFQYNVMGRDYDAAVLAAGSCGFGMGATPNAMANMQALTDKFVPSIKAYLLVPIIGSMFADFINSITITIFINMF